MWGSTLKTARAQDIFWQENFSRSLAAFSQNNGRAVFLAWRMLKTDSPKMEFDIYRKEETGSYQKLQHLNATNYLDKTAELGKTYYYKINPTINGQPGKESNEAMVTTTSENKNYWSIKLKNGDGISRVVPADLDGDGELEFVVMTPLTMWMCGDDYTSTVNTARLNIYDSCLFLKPDQTIYYEAYDVKTGLMWTFDTGIGQRGEAFLWEHALTAWDMDGDKKAEVIARAMLPDGNYYIVILNGQTGEIKNKMINPAYSSAHNYRYMFGIAYLDGKKPAIIIQTGNYHDLQANDFINLEAYDSNLKPLWKKSGQEDNLGDGTSGHCLKILDYEGDGNDEILLGDNLIDEKGNLIWTQGLGHCDVIHPGNINSSIPGYEVAFGSEACAGGCPGEAKVTLVSMGDGEKRWLKSGFDHIHEGYVSDVIKNKNFPGWEISMQDNKSQGGGVYYNFASDGREIFNFGELVTKVADPYKAKMTGVPKSFDVAGDYRKEIVMLGVREIRIYFDTTISDKKLPTPLQDRYYRQSLARLGVGYCDMAAPDLLDPDCYFEGKDCALPGSYSVIFQYRMDFNCDRVVDISDFGILLSHWNQTANLNNYQHTQCGGEKKLDLVANNKIDMSDLGAMLACWGTSEKEICLEK